jgi:hypothetical protein
MLERLTFLVGSLYAEALEAVKSRAALSASSSQLISVIVHIISQVSLWNLSQSMNFVTAFERFLDLT